MSDFSACLDWLENGKFIYLRVGRNTTALELV